jgi:uncharacterized Zn-finger protein
MERNRDATSIEPTGSAQRSGLLEPNAESRYEITRAVLPLACPMPQMSLWNSHPRVYLPIEETGEARCPYCGAVYVLKDRER